MPSPDRTAAIAGETEPSGNPAARRSKPRPVLALLHGWGMNARVFDRLSARLSARFDVRALELPGHGDRAALTVNTLQTWADDLVQQLPERTTLLGWSLGGQVALRAALDHPGKIARLILMASTPRFVEGEDWARGIAESDLLDFGTALAAEPQATLLRFLSLQTRGAADQKALLQQLRRAFAEAPIARPEALAGGLAILRSADLRAEAIRLTQPTLVLHGGLDTLTPPAAGAWLAEILPNAEYIAFPRAAHAPHLSHGEAVARAIERLIHD